MKYAQEQKSDGEWASHIIISACTLLLDLRNELYIPGHSNPFLINPSGTETINLLNSNRNHFQVLFSKKEKSKSLNWNKLYSKAKKIENKNRKIPIESLNIFAYPDDGKNSYKDIVNFLTDKIYPERISYFQTSINKKGQKVYKSKKESKFREICSRYKLLDMPSNP